MATFHGIQVYEILEDGNLLNGVYTNTGLLRMGNYDVDNEIARKKVYDDKGIDGQYDCRYIETNNKSVENCELQITKRQGGYDFIWRKKGKTIYSGIGLMSGNNHIAVSYIKV